MKRTLSHFIIVRMAMMGCEQEISDPGPGPKTSVAEIEKAQDLALQDLDPGSIQQGQKVYKIETQEVFSTQAPIKNLSKEWTTEVTQVNDEGHQKIVTTLKKVRETDDDFIYEFKNVYAFDRMVNFEAHQETHTESHSTEQAYLSLQSGSLQLSNQIEGVAFHNLQSVPVTLQPPEKVKNSPDCRGLKDCQIQATLIAYNVVFQLTDGSTQTHNVEWYVTNQVPFFAGLFKQCATSLVPIENVSVLVKQCTEVVDFNW